MMKMDKTLFWLRLFVNYFKNRGDGVTSMAMKVRYISGMAKNQR